jgi:hypothetical protein
MSEGLWLRPSQSCDFLILLPTQEGELLESKIIETLLWELHPGMYLLPGKT